MVLYVVPDSMAYIPRVGQTRRGPFLCGEAATVSRMYYCMYDGRYVCPVHTVPWSMQLPQLKAYIPCGRRYLMRRLGLSPPPPITGGQTLMSRAVRRARTRRGEARRETVAGAAKEEDAPAMSLLDAGSRRKLVEGFTTMLITSGAR